jgi:hypothetical protein
MKFVCEFALENARNSVLELQKCKNFLGEDPQTEDTQTDALFSPKT